MTLPKGPKMLIFEKILWNTVKWPERKIFQCLFFAQLLRKKSFYAVGEDAQPCLAYSPTALNELNLAVAPPFVGQMKKKLQILSFHTIRDRLGQKTISRYCPFKIKICIVEVTEQQGGKLVRLLSHLRPRIRPLGSMYMKLILNSPFSNVSIQQDRKQRRLFCRFSYYTVLRRLEKYCKYHITSRAFLYMIKFKGTATKRSITQCLCHLT